MRILITGATGLIGSSLTARLLGLSHQLTVLTRDPQRARSRLGDQPTYRQTLDDYRSLNEFDAVLNLAGEPIADQRWSAKQKKRLCYSRWDLTERLATMINASSTPPRVLISGSAVGYYGNQGQAVVTEEDPPHDEFTHQLCQRWESLALQAQSDATRVCLLRTGVVLAAQGGAFAKMLRPFRLGLGGPIGNGRQYLPWIHLEDMISGIIFLLEHETLQGPFNMVAPYPVHNEQFAAQLANVLDRPAFMRVPAFVMRLLMGEAAALVLGGQRAVPRRLEQAGFHFHYLELEQALNHLIKQQRATAR